MFWSEGGISRRTAMFQCVPWQTDCCAFSLWANMSAAPAIRPLSSWSRAAERFNSSLPWLHSRPSTRCSGNRALLPPSTRCLRAPLLMSLGEIASCWPPSPCRAPQETSPLRPGSWSLPQRLLRFLGARPATGLSKTNCLKMSRSASSLSSGRPPFVLSPEPCDAPFPWDRGLCLQRSLQDPSALPGQGISRRPYPWPFVPPLPSSSFSSSWNSTPPPAPFLGRGEGSYLRERPPVGSPPAAAVRSLLPSALHSRPRHLLRLLRVPSLRPIPLRPCPSSCAPSAHVWCSPRWLASHTPVGIRGNWRSPGAELCMPVKCLRDPSLWAWWSWCCPRATSRTSRSLQPGELRLHNSRPW